MVKQMLIYLIGPKFGNFGGKQKSRYSLLWLLNFKRLWFH